MTSSQVRQAILAARKVAPSVARDLVYRLSTVFKWAIAEGMRQDNPARAEVLALPRDETPKRPCKALPYDAVAPCLATIRASRAALSTKLALELLVLTAGRSGEVREADWSEIDRDAAVWAIPAIRMKMKMPTGCRPCPGRWRSCKRRRASRWAAASSFPARKPAGRCQT